MNPAAMYASRASFTSGIMFTRPFSNFGSCSSAFLLWGANFSSAIASAVSSAAMNVSRECSANRGRCVSAATSRLSKSWNSRSRRLTIRDFMAPLRCVGPRTVRLCAGDLHVLETFPERALQELSHGRARDLVHEDERVGEPEPGEERLQVFAELLLRGARALLQHHARDRSFIPLRVLHRDHRRLLHGGVAHERVLEIDGADPLAT